MSDKTAIEWTDATWNPIRGCSRVSQGCVHCYAEGVARRFSGPGQPYEGLVNKHGTWNGEILFVEKALSQPLRWRRPRRIFVNSMSDLFHENVTDLEITRIFDVMEAASWHTFQVLTKRPARMKEFCEKRQQNRRDYAKQFDSCPTEEMRNSPAAEEAKARAARPSHNIWLGVSVENQATADERIPLLLQTPAAVRFLSCEPLLGAINLTDMDWIHACDCGHIKAAHSGPDETGACWCPTSWANGNAFKPTSHCSCTEYRKKLHWVIVGGESGRGARPMHPDWARSLRDQCSAAGVPYFFKQWGAWAEVEWDGDITIDADGVLASEVYDPKYDCLLSVDGRSFTWKDLPDNIPARLMQRMRKKYTGRLLDGRLHDEFPREKA